MTQIFNSIFKSHRKKKGIKFIICELVCPLFLKEIKVPIGKKSTPGKAIKAQGSYDCRGPKRNHGL